MGGFPRADGELYDDGNSVTYTGAQLGVQLSHNFAGNAERGLNSHVVIKYQYGSLQFVYDHGNVLS